MPRNDRPLLQRPCRQAATALEFAVVLPLLLTLVLGCVDLGRFAHSYIVVTNAARTGASFATVNPYTQATYSLWIDSIRQAIDQEMTGLSQYDHQALDVTTTVIPESSQSWCVQIDLSYPFQTLVPWPGLPSSLTLRQTVVMRTMRP